MSRVPYRKFVVRPIHLGNYSRAIILPAWWLRLNENPDKIELSLTLDSLMVRPARGEESNGPEYPDAVSDG